MKKNTIFYVLASALALFSCAKEKSPAPEQDAPMRFAVTVEGTTKASMTSADLTQFYLKVTGPNNAFSYFESITKDAQGNWTASQPILWKDEESAITYAAASYGALGADYFNISVKNELFTSGATMGLLTDQSTQAKLNAADLLTMASTDLTFAASNKGIVPITLKHGLAKVNFVVSIENAGELTAEGIKDVVVSGVYNGFSFKPLTGEVTIPSPAPKKGVVVPFLSSVEAGKATLEAVLVPETLAAGALSLYITVNGKDFQWTNSEALALAQGGEYTVPVSIDYNTVPSGPVTPDPGDTVLDGAINGKFSVSATKQVYFSKGNLRYASSKWSFFDNQYDYYNSHNADAWDKFGWSTSATTYGMNTSDENSTYSGDFVDWGATMGTGWFTLSSAEWTYLLNTRSASNVGGTANGRYAKAEVNDVMGVILFPDTYVHPDGVTAPTGVNATDNTGWNNNSYTVADWTKMESAGCVFLPAAGGRSGSSVNDPGWYGYYWSATLNGASNPYYVTFTSGILNPTNSYTRSYGYSVRLVRQVAAADPAAARTLAEATAEDLGKIVGADGKIYANVAAAQAASTTACAIIAYVGSETGEASPYNHGLAIAMKDATAGGTVKWSSSSKDESQTNYDDPASAIAAKESGSALSSGRDNDSYPAFKAALANSITVSDGISAAAPASGTTGWFLPSLYQWNMIVKGLSGQSADLSYSTNDNYTASNLNTKIVAAGGTGLQNVNYWSSTECVEQAAWFFNASFGKVDESSKGGNKYVRSAFAF